MTTSPRVLRTAAHYVRCSASTLSLISILAGACLLAASHPAHSQTPGVVFRGTPEYRVESYEDEEVRYQLDAPEAAEAEVVIVATEDGCVWRSRGDRPLTATISGGYIIFETRTPSASYVKVVRGATGEYTAPPELGQIFLEHVSQGLNTISYRGRTVELHRPERCVIR